MWRSQIQQTPEQTHTQADQRDHDEDQQDRSVHDRGPDRAGPAHGSREDVSDIANQAGDRNSSSRAAKPPFSRNEYLDRLADEAEADQTK